MIRGIRTEKDAEPIIKELKKYPVAHKRTDLPHNSVFYGIGEIIKAFYDLPKELRFDNWEMPHGVTIDEDFLSFKDVNCSLLLSTDNSAALYRDNGQRAVAIGNPFVMARKMAGITQTDDAAGTIAFPTHSTYKSELIFNWDDYAQALLDLPEEFQPVSVCLYFMEILNGTHKHFLDRGIPVHTAGHMFDEKFAYNFYNILRRFKYSTSNSIGSQLFYSVEMGIPFFFYGDDVQVVLKQADHHHGVGIVRPEEFQVQKRHYHSYFRLFNYTGKAPEISAAAKSLVEEKLGVELINNGPSQKIRRRILLRWRRMQLGRILRHYKVLR